MCNSNNSPNSVGADFAATFDSVPDIFDKTAAATPISEDGKGGFPDDNGGTTGGGNKTVDEVMFIIFPYSLRKSYNSVNKAILQFFLRQTMISVRH